MQSTSPVASSSSSLPPSPTRKMLDDSFDALPRAFASLELSPASSATSSELSDLPRFTAPSPEIFAATRSRVVRFFGLPDPPEKYLAAVLYSPQSKIPLPLTMWTLRSEHRSNTVWAVYKTHDEACRALSLSSLGPHLSLAPALEHDLEPFHKLRRVDLSLPDIMHKTQSHVPALQRPNMLQLRPVHIAPSHFQPDVSHPEFTLSSNPPNPRTSFRLGDWICSSPKCAAHNFGRNVHCIGCGCPRASSGMNSPAHQLAPIVTRPLPSPRFAASPNSQASFSPTTVQHPPSYPSSPAPPVKSTNPLLTPSGRAFASGGRVQNTSTDPLNPCIMFWPDNEPFPEIGQIRPSGLVGIAQPPILNTGNRGPISHQPGDWVCHKCNYLNWRRRKVCQTCFPYAEGNGDSISAAVQAERIALLTNVLAKTQGQMPAPQRSHSMTPPQVHRPFINSSPPHGHAPVHRSQSHFELGSQYSNVPASGRPIYQTSGHVHAPAPAPLLPSFLQEIVQSPMLSPASTSSADLSFDEYDQLIMQERAAAAAHQSSKIAALASIWKMDGHEFSAIRSRQSSRERVHHAL
ncbi:hypothetical protein CYLTODRAFT_420871 [Cylindrobasidium torrendii FP15055 ss-10]|uniref:RanBP2-type domain-containing protein n=1 Tax=Cylindrobasidium torrendii FP15055 ss-10 TaxID=1314674 RepID=A0A0D7BGF2_9AGAR|nr:hypothetical protein CYLTODRAFT_420871 [Cylindrobasidium torrendii FP15055 ss-10]